MFQVLSSLKCNSIDVIKALRDLFVQWFLQSYPLSTDVCSKGLEQAYLCLLNFSLFRYLHKFCATRPLPLLIFSIPFHHPVIDTSG